jgi:hypothetical protein
LVDNTSDVLDVDGLARGVDKALSIVVVITTESVDAASTFVCALTELVSDLTLDLSNHRVGND